MRTEYVPTLFVDLREYFEISVFEIWILKCHNKQISPRSVS